MQGSENKNIVVVMSDQHYMWKGEGCKKLLYTAVSRAKEQLTILSCMGAFSESVNKYCGKPEKSFHSEFLIKM
jgi:ATP-dependent exoDNAse (exonuclease V) alpha subunit